MKDTNNALEKIHQTGGFMMIIPKIGEILGIVVMAIMQGMANLFKSLFMIRKTDEIPFLYLDTGEGLVYKYIWFSAKCGFYLVVFAFGGPLIAVIGIILLYKNLFSKFKELKKEEGEKSESSNDSNDSSQSS